ncbi:MAG: hypothetical protein COB02_14345 [Candidatus Cloacimonadota bacterium]|nr:MAG: hypothetical protein COB02_14345 [Candidatus Cloacimonadota bacterium]
MHLLDKEQSQFLVLASLKNSFFVLDNDLRFFLDSYLKLLYKGLQLPLPGILYDLYAVLRGSKSQNFERVSFDFDDQYQNQWLDKVKFSQLMKDSKEISLFFKGNEYFYFYELFIELFYSKQKIPSSYLEIKPVYIKDLLKRFDEEDIFTQLNETSEWHPYFDPSLWILSYEESQIEFNGEDLWELRHVTEIANDSDRFAIKKCHEAKRYFYERSVSILKKIRMEIEPTYTEDKKNDGDYPLGGITGITNKGSFESLLGSELIYSEVDSEIDLFDIKYIENELLYYERDANQLEECWQEIHLFFYSQNVWPNLNECSIYPFFFFALLSFMIEFSDKIHDRYKFKFKIIFECKKERDTEFYKILEAFLSVYKDFGRVEIVFVDQHEEVVKRLSQFKEIHFGKKIIYRSSCEWKDLFISTYFSKSNQEQKLILDEEGFISFLKWNFKTLFS